MLPVFKRNLKFVFLSLFSVVIPINQIHSSSFSAEDIEPGTVIAVAQLAVSTAKLFQDRDDGYRDHTITLLNQINERLSIINSKIDRVLEALNDIDDKLERIPGEIADELNRRKVNAFVFEHKAMLELYHSHISSGGSDSSWYSNSIMMSRLDEDLSNLRAARNELFTRPTILLDGTNEYKRFIVLPLANLALFMEYDFMRLRGMQQQEMRVDLGTYQRFFSSSLEALNSLIIENKNKRDTLDLRVPLNASDAYDVHGVACYSGSYSFINRHPDGADHLFQNGVIELQDLFYPVYQSYSSSTTAYGGATVHYCNVNHRPDQFCPHSKQIVSRRNSIESGYRHWISTIDLMDLDNFYYWSSMKFAGENALAFLRETI